MTSKTVKIGTRASKLAVSQTRMVIEQLSRFHPQISFEIVKISTHGDTDRTSSLEEIGGTGLFTKQIENALLEKTVDIAIHSAKDLPSVMTEGLCLGAVPKRAPSEDVWLARDGIKLAEMKADKVVGTSSPRRRALLMNIRPDLRIADVRGNIETRIRKLTDGLYDALIMARAGLVRAGLEGAITEVLPLDKFIPAPGQGSLAVQVREDDEETGNITAAIDDADTHRCLEIERSLLARLKAGCSTPIGGYCKIEDDYISLEAVVLDRGGKTSLLESHRISTGDADSMLVDKVVEGLLAQGAGKLIESF